MRILDLFSGTGSATKAFSDAGHEVVGVELDEKFNAHERDVMKLSAQYLIDTYGKFDFIWASPPCTTFSIASCGYHWKDGKPSDKALQAENRVVMLLPSRTDTQWFHRLWNEANNIEFVKGRLKFGDGRNAAPFPSIIVTL